MGGILPVPLTQLARLDVFPDLVVPPKHDVLLKEEETQHSE
jgi:hypothetical protein